MQRARWLLLPPLNTPQLPKKEDVAPRIRGACVASTLSPSGPIIATGCQDMVGILCSLDLSSTLEAVACLYPRAGMVEAVQWSTEGRKLAVSCEEGIVVYCRVGTNTTREEDQKKVTSKVFELEVSHRLDARGLQASGFVPNHESLYYTLDGSYKMWRLNPRSVFQAAEFSPFERVRADECKQVDIKAIQTVASSPSAKIVVQELVMSPDGRWIATTLALSRHAKLHEVRKRGDSEEDGVEEPATQAFNRVSSVAVGTLDSVVASAPPPRTLYLPHTRAITSVSWRDSSAKTSEKRVNVLLTCCLDGAVRLWKEVFPAEDPQSGAPSFVLVSVLQAQSCLALPEVSPSLNVGLRCAAWVLEVSPGYKQRALSGTFNGSLSGSFAKEKYESSTGSMSPSLLVTGEGSGLRLWSVAGLENRCQPTASATCLLTLSAEQLGRTDGSGSDIVHVQSSIFEGSCAGDDAGRDKCELSLLMTDTSGALTNAVVSVNIPAAFPDGSLPYSMLQPAMLLSLPLSDDTGAVGVSSLTPEFLKLQHLGGDFLMGIPQMRKPPNLLPPSLTSPIPISSATASAGVLHLRIAALNPMSIKSLGSSDAQPPCSSSLLYFGMKEGGVEVTVPDLSARIRGGRSRPTYEDRAADSAAFLRSDAHEISEILPVGSLQDPKDGSEVVIIAAIQADGSLLCGSTRQSRGGARSKGSSDGEAFDAVNRCEGKLESCQSVGCGQLAMIRVPESINSSHQTHHTQAVSEGQDATFFFFGTDNQGQIFLFSATLNKDLTLRIEQLGSFGDLDGPLNILKVLSPSCVAAVKASNPNVVDIWRAVTSPHLFDKIGSSAFSSPLRSLSWYQPGLSPLPILLVATNSRIAVLNAWDTTLQQVEGSAEAKPRVSVLWALDVPSLSSAAWTTEGQILLLTSGGLTCMVPELWYHLKSQSSEKRVFQAEGFAVIEDIIIGNAGNLVSTVKEAAATLRPVLQGHNPQCLQMFWTNGQVEVLQDTLEKLKSAMEYSGLRKEVVLHVDLHLLLSSSATQGASAKESKKKDTAEGLFDTFGFGGFGDSAEPQSKEAEAAKAVLEILNSQPQEASVDLKKAISADPQELRTFLEGLLAVMEGSGVKLDSAAQKFAMAATVSSKQLRPQQDDEDQGIKVQFNIWKVVNAAEAQAQAGRVETELGPGVGYVDIAWAMLSDSQEEILKQYLGPQDMVWDYIAGLGVPLWLTSLAELKSIVERLAKAQFTRERNPMDCLLMYLALDKKTTLTAMFKAVKNDKLAGFMARDFSEEANKAAAIKNACTLLSQHKNGLAAGFFILAGAWNDAFDTILLKKNDPMLAILLARINPSVFETGMQAVHQYFVKRGEMIGAGLTLWRRGKHLSALQALMEVGENACKGLRGVERAVKLNSILSLCSGLREHPQVKRALTVQPEVPSMLDAWGGMDTPTSSGSLEPEGATKADINEVHEKEQALRLRAAFELAIAGCPDLALQQMVQREMLLEKHRLTSQGVTSNIFAKASISTPKATESTGFKAWTALAVSGLVKACCGEMLGERLPFTPDWVHPSTLQLKDPETVAKELKTFSAALQEASVVNQSDLTPVALGECEWRDRSDCYVNLCISEATTPLAFEHFFQMSSGIPEALRGIQVQARSDTAAQTYMRLAQRVSSAARVFGDQGLGLGDWLGEHAETSSALQRMCVTTYSYLFLSFWMSRDAAGLTLLLAKSPSFSGPGMQSRSSLGRTSDSSSCASAMVKIFRKGLVRCATLPRCSWAGVWAISSKEMQAIQGSAPQVHADTYGQRHFDAKGAEGVKRVQEMAVELTALSALQALIEQALASEVKGEVGELVLAMRHALSAARTRMARQARDVASKGTAEEVAAELEPLLLLSASPQAIGTASDLGAAQVCKAVSNSDSGKVFVGLKEAAASILSAAETEEQKGFGLRGRGQQVQARREEVLLSQRGEVLRSLCIRADEGSGTVLAVASNKCIREAHCRADGKGGVSAGHQTSDSTPEASSIGSSVDGVLEMIWDRVATSAAEVVQIGLEGGQGHAQMGAAALAAHPSLPVFLSGGFDGQILLWGFGAPQPLNHYAPLSSAPISKVVFEPEGRLFAVCEGTGLCGVWLMDSSRPTSSESKPMDIVQGGNSKRIYSLAFLGGGTMLATAGMGSGPTVRVWDLLLPSSKSCVAALSLHDGTANSLTYLPDTHMIVSGGHRGDISFTDTRTWRTVRTMTQGHKSNVRALAADPSERLLVSGGTDGDMKVWDVRRLRDGDGESACVQHIEGGHEKGTFLRAGSSTHIGTYGVMDILATSSSFYSCGADGRVVRRPWAPSA